MTYDELRAALTDKQSEVIEWVLRHDKLEAELANVTAERDALAAALAEQQARP